MKKEKKRAKERRKCIGKERRKVNEVNVNSDGTRRNLMWPWPRECSVCFNFSVFF